MKRQATMTIREDQESVDRRVSVEDDPLAPSTLVRDLGILIVVALVISAVVYAVGEWVAGDSELGVTGFDLPVLEFFEDLRSRTLTSVMQGATLMGGTPVTMILLLAAAVGSFLVTRNPRWPIFFVAALLGLRTLERVEATGGPSEADVVAHLRTHSVGGLAQRSRHGIGRLLMAQLHTS